LRSGLIRGLIFGESGLLRGVTSFEGDNLVVFYYLKASEISDLRQVGGFLWILWFTPIKLTVVMI
jgi:hypothetical protein